MSGNRSDHDFDWMRDYLVCSVACEFDLLKTDAKGATDTYSEAYKQKYPQSTVQFQCKPGKEEYDYFVVSKTDEQYQHSGTSVVFTNKEHHIEIAVKDGSKGRATNIGKSHKITLTLNNEGQCRYQIDGEGERLRWQVLKSMLLGFVFPDPVQI